MAPEAFSGPAVCVAGVVYAEVSAHRSAVERPDQLYAEFKTRNLIKRFPNLNVGNDCMRAQVTLVVVVSVLLGAMPISQAASGKGNSATGQKLYQESCLNCHGPAGKGDSEMAAYLTPAPANLTSNATQAKPDAQLRKVIQEGRPGTAMTGYAAVFDEGKLDDIIAYIRSLKP